jgi:hypothetical protein
LAEPRTLLQKEKTMSRDEYKVPTYPIVKFLVANGVPLSVALGCVPFLVGIYLATLGWGFIFPIAGLFLSIILGGFLLSYIEVLRIIADTLIPR